MGDELALSQLRSIGYKERFSAESVGVGSDCEEAAAFSDYA